MAGRERIRTTISQAVEYWSQKESECGLSVDWSEAHTHCWRCGCKKNLQRCHIVPHSLGGKDEPANIVLLCKRCHAEGPNVSDPEVMWDWIRAYGVPLYETFWYVQGMKEYEFIYKKTVERELLDIIQAANLDDTSAFLHAISDRFARDVTREASIHFGQPYFNTATIAGIYRMLIKALAKEYGVEFPLTSVTSEQAAV